MRLSKHIRKSLRCFLQFADFHTERLNGSTLKGTCITGSPAPLIRLSARPSAATLHRLLLGSIALLTE